VIGNSVIVVDDKDMIERADYVIDIGPKGEMEAKSSVWNSSRNPEIKYDYRTIF
jgi:excinuclease UvrABC ATPase subunit